MDDHPISARAVATVKADSLIGEIPYMRRYARALTHQAAAADDLVQDALLRALSSLERFQPGSNLRGWLLAIVHNIFIDGTRKAKRARDGDQAAHEMMNGLYSPPNQLANLQMGELRIAFGHLPQDQKNVLRLIGLEQTSYEEAARRLKVPVGTVRSRVWRGRQSLMAEIHGQARGDIAAQSGVARRDKPRRPRRVATNVPATRSAETVSYAQYGAAE